MPKVRIAAIPVLLASALLLGGCASDNFNDLDAFMDEKRIALPQTSLVRGVDVTNTAWARTSMLEGDQFAKKFGGATGDDPDWFMVTFTGYDAKGCTMLELTPDAYIGIADRQARDI